MTGSARRPAILRAGTLIEAVDQAERNDARALKAIFPLCLLLRRPTNRP